MNKLSLILVAFAVVVSFNACDSGEPEPPTPTDSSINVNISHTFGGAEFKLNDRYYVTANGDSIQPTKFIYHINNFVFITENGDEVKPETQYFMVNGSDDMSPGFDMGKLSGNFTKVRFTLGVADSATNADGALNSLFIDPMYWSMAAGYINFKLEAKSPDIPGNNVLTLHLGGYQGIYKINHTFELELGNYQLKSELGYNNLNLQMDVAELFKNPNLIDISVTSDVQMPNDNAKMLAENFASMITFKSTN